ncbi:SidA/IucD/PvdA family monooxygenase [Pigmentibacter ruber]|uniref:SidA/IucD/PvdA family monooxygenase n=1 Tax=Pigmentibacter ruber TaxID=2683196 RepID=UPI00131D14B8|nr:SidA/IucD/PvdA family monooxygenase [Pigmentibacter ruber]
MNFTDQYEWAVVGAGPAGIAAVGKLLDNGINSNKILWIDPDFSVGDFGKKWHLVPSNTRVKLFLNFLTECSSFDFLQKDQIFEIEKIPTDETCNLGIMAEALQWITNHLKLKVHFKEDIMTTLKMKNRFWQLDFQNNKQIFSKNVILATGSEEKTLTYSDLKTIPLEIALNPNKLKDYSNTYTSIAVFGSSHSAILVLRNILENCPNTKVFNFYKSQLCYALISGDTILHDNTGLKGTTAQWAKEYLHGNLPENLTRIHIEDDNSKTELLKCTHAIYAIGFQKRNIQIDGFSNCEYNPQTGIIAPGLFGFGIAFPQLKQDKFGNKEYHVGLWKFMNYINNIMPIWLSYSI